MLAYILRRLILVVPTLFGIMVLNFFIAKGGLKPTDVSIIGTGAGAPVIAALDQGRVDKIASAIVKPDPATAASTRSRVW